MKRPMILLSLLLCLQGCMTHPVVRSNQDPAAVADAVAHEGGGGSDLPPPKEERDSKTYFTTLAIIGGIGVVVGAVVLLVVLSKVKDPTSNSPPA